MLDVDRLRVDRGVQITVDSLNGVKQPVYSALITHALSKLSLHFKTRPCADCRAFIIGATFNRTLQYLIVFCKGPEWQVGGLGHRYVP